MSKLAPIEIDPKKFLYEHCTLPALPEVLSKIQEAMYSSSVSVEGIANYIKNDPALTAQVLKIVNSAYYSLPISISDAKLAVAYLGINEVYRIVLSLSVINSLASDEKEEFKNIWFHSLLTAFSAKYIAKKFEPLLNIDELWTAALLHDVGKLVYLKFFPEHYKEIRTYSLDNGCLFSEAEKHYSFPSSAFLGSLLCERWRLAEKISEACLTHSIQDLEKMNEEGSTDSFTSMVILGNVFAVLTTDKLNKEYRERIIKTIHGTLNINESNFMFIMSEIVDLKEEALKLIS